MTPAERLSHTKRRDRPKRNPAPAPQRRVWVTTLREVRESLDLSMRDAAKACGLAVPSYFRIEHGFADPGLSTAKRIAEFYGRSVWELWVKVIAKEGQ